MWSLEARNLVAAILVDVSTLHNTEFNICMYGKGLEEESW